MDLTYVDTQHRADHQAAMPDLTNVVPAIDPETGRVLYVDPSILWPSAQHTPPETPVPSPAAPVADTGEVTQPAPAPAVDTRISGRAKGAALLIASGGAAVTAVTTAVGHYAPQLDTAGHAVQMGGIGVGIAAASLAGATIAIKAALGGVGKRPGRTVIHHTEHHTHNTTATGMFARARSAAPRISR